MVKKVGEQLCCMKSAISIYIGGEDDLLAINNARAVCGFHLQTPRVRPWRFFVALISRPVAEQMRRSPEPILCHPLFEFGLFTKILRVHMALYAVVTVA